MICREIGGVDETECCRAAVTLTSHRERETIFGLKS